MFCKQCGKPTNGSEVLCEDCKAKLAGRNIPEPEPEGPSVILRGFGRALASTITGFGVFIVSNVLAGSGRGMYLISMIMLLIVDIAAIVCAIVFGSQAIRLYGTFKDSSKKKPTPAFVLGIIGVVLAGISAVITIVFLCVDLPVIV